MSFNKAKEERKWLHWKKVEEQQMHELGTSEDVIRIIRDADWTTFKAERCYYEKTEVSDLGLSIITFPVVWVTAR